MIRLQRFSPNRLQLADVAASGPTFSAEAKKKKKPTQCIPSLSSLFFLLLLLSPPTPAVLSNNPVVLLPPCQHLLLKTAAFNRTISWGCDIDSLENAEALQKWLSDSGLPPQKMAIERVDVGERGLVALKKELQIHNRRRRILEASAVELLTAAVFPAIPPAVEMEQRTSMVVRRE